jgi:rhamnosyltransferase subunit B
LSPKRLVLTTFGSLGDLHPYIAIALEWQKRGHDAVIATSETYRSKVESEGIEFASVRPDLPDGARETEMMRRVMDLRGGPEYLLKDVICNNIRDSHDDLLAACRGADALLGHPLTFAVPIVAHRLGLRWAYGALSPPVFMSAYDPPIIAQAPWLAGARKLGPQVYSVINKLMHASISSWFNPVRQLSRESGTYSIYNDPMGKHQYSPYLNLALFSSLFASPQPDWPVRTVLTGFPFYDKTGGSPDLSPELTAFLAKGDPPIVFTLGSAAVMNAGSFYEISAAAAHLIGRRAILLIGRGPSNTPVRPLPDSIGVFEYAPYSKLFPLCSVVVHQGGIGTTSQTLRSGKPMLVVPFAFDQPDNGYRSMRLGVGSVMRRSDYNVQSVQVALGDLLSQPKFAQCAIAISRVLKLENGASAASDALESYLF